MTTLCQNVLSQGIRITEVMSSNSTSFYDEDLSTPDWIELYNEGPRGIDLLGYGLSDDIKQRYKWIFPSIYLHPGEYLVVAASGKNRKTLPVYWESLVSVGDTFRYSIPYSEPGPWQNKDYDDETWILGTSGLGYGDNDDATIIPDGTTTLLARRKFHVYDLSTIKQMTLHMDYDDSFVAYLNGHVIARAEGSDHEAKLYRGGEPDAFLCDEAIPYLVRGENLLAVEVHNVSDISMDMSCIPFLSIGRSVRSLSSGIMSPYLTLQSSTLHTNFKIDSSGDTIVLTSPLGRIVDSLYTGNIPTDVSLGYKPGIEHIRYLFEKSTPGAANLSHAYPVRTVNDPIFSHTGGLLSGPINLAISGAGPGDTIWYTNDGSAPKRGTKIYTGPVSIDESQVIKAVITGHKRMNRKPVSHSFLLREEEPALTTISLSTDPPNLFDWDTGIYVLGPRASTEEPYLGANFWEDWERPVHIELYEPDGSLGMESDAGMKIYGSWSRAFGLKSLAFYARSKYGSKVFDNKLFLDLPFTEYNNFLLRNSGNDLVSTMFRDALMTSLLYQTDLDRQAYKPASVYINGNYWGIMNIREKINEHFLATHHGVDPYQIDFLEDTGNPIVGDPDHYNNMLDFLNNNSPALAENYNRAKSLMDVENFMEYQIAEIYFDNVDWPGNNLKFWRPKTPGGKWKWIVFDTDLGFGLYSDDAYAHNSLAFALTPDGPEYPNPPWSTFLLRRLMENQEFKNGFINRFADRLNTAFSYQTVLQHIDQMSNAIADEIPFHNARWNLWNGDVEEWRNNVEGLRVFAGNRVSYMRRYIGQQFSDIDTASIRLLTSAPQSGNIRLNSLMLKSFPWKGVYFEDIPVRIKAIPGPGYRFVNWEGPVDEPLSSFTTVNLSGYSTVKAVFMKDGSNPGDIVINEIYYQDPAGFDADDWVELYNMGEAIVDLSGWILQDDDPSHSFIIPAGTLLDPNDYLVICRNASKFKKAYPDVRQAVGDLSFGLNNTGDCIKMYSDEQDLVDKVCYGVVDPWPPEPNINGVSVELIQPVYDNSMAINWQASAALHGTPGKINDGTPTAVDPEIKQPLTRGTVQCYPNPFSSFTRIRFELMAKEWIRLSVCDLQGHFVITLFEGDCEPGVKELIWDGRDYLGSLPGTGIFICVLQTKTTVVHCKLVMNR